MALLKKSKVIIIYVIMFTYSRLIFNDHVTILDVKRLSINVDTHTFIAYYLWVSSFGSSASALRAWPPHTHTSIAYYLWVWSFGSSASAHRAWHTQTSITYGLWVPAWDVSNEYHKLILERFSYVWQIPPCTLEYTLIILLTWNGLKSS